MEPEKKKKLRGDRRDAALVRDADTMHRFMPYLMPNRADNEAVLTETVELDAINDYLKELNAGSPDFKYTFFHVICAAIAKTVALRPKMNRYYAGDRLYQRNEISLSFVVKKQFADNSDEGLAIVKVDPDKPEGPLEQIYTQVKKIVTSVRHENKTDDTTSEMDKLLKAPRPILRLIMRFLRWLDYHDWYPKSLMDVDPDYSTVFVTNLGSIKMHADYHHLVNWGTNSVFVVINEKKLTPVFKDDGSYEMKETLSISVTLDERIADGFYFAKSIGMLREIIKNPRILSENARATDENIEKYV